MDTYCVVCGATLVATGLRGRPSIFCSPDHKRAFAKERIRLFENRRAQIDRTVGRTRRGSIPSTSQRVNLKSLQAVTTTPLDEFEMRVLTFICERRRIHSSVILALELFGESKFEWLQMEAILRDLNEHDLVTYTLGDHDIYIRIKPTPKAYRLTGVDNHYVTMIGSDNHPQREPELRQGDRTDFRFHGQTAGWNPVEVMSIEDHMAAYYDHAHLHLDQLEEWWDQSS